MRKKIALINLYFGNWPVWFPAFLQSCKYNPGVDWLLFTDCIIPAESPENVRFVPFSMADFNALASDKLGFDVCLSKPYKVCEFKTTYGVVFEEYLKDYDFWGHCDIDIIWGDIRRFITDEILRDYDIISSRKGIMSGHFSLYRNTPPTSMVFTQYPGYQNILQFPDYCFFDEDGITLTIRCLAQQGVVNVYWPAFLFNFTNPSHDKPSFLGKYRNRWYWERGKLYEQTERPDEAPREVMYLHFMTWKRSMRACNVQFAEDPSAFHISYSHVGLTPLDSPPLASSLMWDLREVARGLRRTWRRTKRRLMAS